MASFQRLTVVVSLALAVLTSYFVPTFSQVNNDLASLRQFVQGFYDWYVPIALKEANVPAFDIALKRKPSAFSPELVKALQEDSAAQAKVPDDIVGIDWDPFLYCQDPDDHYAVGRITKQGRTYLVELYGIQGGKKRPTVAVIAEVAQADGKWFFVNFHSAEGGDLLNALASAKKSRQKATK